MVVHHREDARRRVMSPQKSFSRKNFGRWFDVGRKRSVEKVGWLSVEGREGDRFGARLSRPRFRRAPAYHHMHFKQGLPVTPSLPVRVSSDSDQLTIRVSSRQLLCESLLDWDHQFAWRSTSKGVHTKSYELERSWWMGVMLGNVAVLMVGWEWMVRWKDDDVWLKL